MTWLTARAIAEKTGKHITTIEKLAKAKNGKYRYSKGRGRAGRTMLIALETLPANLQNQYNGILPEPKDILSFSQKQREAADYKAFIVEEYWRSGLSPDEYIAQYNRTNPSDPLNSDRLFRWQRKYRAAGSNPAALVDRRGGWNRDRSNIHPDAWDYFYSLYMRPQEPKIQRCYKKTKERFPGIPSVSAFERKVRKLPRRAILLYRKGERAFKNSLPHMMRDYTTIESNEFWYSDEHTFDIFVKDSKGVATRFYLTMWHDARSRKPMAWEVSSFPATTDTVKRTLRQGIAANGVPGTLYVDNGGIYKSKDGLNRDFPLSLVNRLNMKVIYAMPYSPEGKGAMERFFGTLEDQFGREFPTYCGKDNIHRPEYLQRPISDPKKYLEKYAPTEVEFIAALEAYILEYCATPHTGQGMNGRTPNEVYATNLKVKAVVSDYEALRLLCGRVATRTVQREGVQMFERFYCHDDLHQHYGEKITAIYDPDNLDELNIFTESGKAICVAVPRLLTSFVANAEDYHQAKLEQKKVRKAIREYRPLRDASTYEIMARNHRQELEYERSGTTQEVEVFNPLLTESRKLAEMKGSAAAAPMSPKDDVQDLQDTWMKNFARGG